MCMECPSGSTCSLYGIEDRQSLEIIKYTSIQPELLDYESDKVSEISKNFYFTISATFVIFIVIFLKFPRTRDFIKEKDMYSQQHNYEEDQPLYIKKTLIGGIFTIVFYFAALGIVFIMILSYSIDNIREIKALVPLAALEQEYDNVIHI
jgi:hypothetical protein